MFAFFFLLILFSIILGFVTRVFDAQEVRYVWLAFLAHVFFAIAQVIYHLEIFKGGDMMGYHGIGEFLAGMVREDSRQLKALIALTLRSSEGTFGWVRGAGSSTGTMFALSALIGLVVGNSMVAKCLVFSMLALTGKIFIYFAFKLHIPKTLQVRALVAALLIPSVTFWSSGIVKESVALSGLGLVLFPIAYFVKRPRVQWQVALIFVLGAALVWISKSYIFVVLGLSGSVWFVAERIRQRQGRFDLGFSRVLLMGLVAVGCILALERFFPEYSLAEVGKETATLQNAYRSQDGGSTFDVQVVRAEQGLAAQIVNIPLAFIASLFRPFLFESRNVAMFANALETTAILLMVIAVLARRGVVGTLSLIKTEPFLLFCAIYVSIFAISLGLAAPNLGTLSRYRIPMFPVYWMFVLALLPLRKMSQPAKSSKIFRYRGRTA